MTRRFSRCCGAVVTTRARSHDLSVIDAYRRTPRIFRMARFARIRTRDVREIFSGRRGPVMTTHAITGDAAVIETRRAPQTRVMTGFAIVTRPNMSRRFTGDKAIVMTTATIAEHGIVIDACYRIPTHHTAMTRRTIGCRINVLRRFCRR